MGSHVVLVNPYYVLSTIILNGTCLYIVDTLTVDGSWGPWRVGQCSVTCSVGTIVRTRECNNPHRLLEEEIVLDQIVKCNHVMKDTVQV